MNAKPHQQFVIDSELFWSGFSVVLNAPTGWGKTWIIQQAIDQVLRQQHRCIYVAPIRALAEELFTQWQERFHPHRVGIFTGDYQTRLPVPFSEAQVLIMTPEKLDACLRHYETYWAWLPKVASVFIDEAHLLREGRRGCTLESVILRLQQVNPFCTITLLSGTLHPDSQQELADWLQGICYRSDWRPVPLRWRIALFSKAAQKQDITIAEVQRNLAARPGNQSLIFTQSRRRAEILAGLLKQAQIAADYHHAGRMPTERSQVEHAFRSKEIQALVTTSSLEMGVNFGSCNQVILADLQQFNGWSYDPISVISAHQRGGRAGRPGLDQEGEVILIAPRWDQTEAQRYIAGNFERIESQIPIHLSEQILIQVASGLSFTLPQLERTFARSFAHHQKKQLPVRTTVEKMIQSGMLCEKVASDRTYLRATSIGQIANRHQITPETILQIRKVLETIPNLTFFDLLLITASLPDCNLSIPLNWENLEARSQQIDQEPSQLLDDNIASVQILLGKQGKALLSAIETATIARAWTRSGDIAQVAHQYQCYPFEVSQIPEIFGRLLMAMRDLASVLDLPDYPETISLTEKIRALEQMLLTGLDEVSATLTLVKGIGPKLARQLKAAGYKDLEDLALADPQHLITIPSVQTKRAEAWVSAAEMLIDQHHSAWQYREEVGSRSNPSAYLARDNELYLLRRSQEYEVQEQTPHNSGLGFIVTGGADLHQVVRNQTQDWQCDCTYFAEHQTCWHILAVKLHHEEPDTQALIQYLNDYSEGSIDLFKLWWRHS